MPSTTFGPVTTTGRATDEFGQPVSAADPATVDVWRAAYDRMLCFTGDPFEILVPLNETDDRLVMGPVFTVAYRLLGGVNPADPAVVGELAMLDRRAEGADERERGHIEAVRLLHAGEFLAAAERWDAVTRQWPEDFTAFRFVHDVCLHIGDDTLRLPSAERAAVTWPARSRAAGLAGGLLAFSLEEVGRYDEAEEVGRRALAVDPGDLWTRHALAHVYESTDRHADSLDLLQSTSARWSHQDLLANHMWWHVGLRLTNHGDLTNAHKVLRDHLRSTTAFGLADSTSLMWRLRLAGLDVDATRWQTEADRWMANANLNTCGFLDLHAAIALAAAPGAVAADQFWDGALAEHPGASYNDTTFRQVVVPLTVGFRALGDGDRPRAHALLAPTSAALHRIGGSVVQREIVGRTVASLADEDAVA